MPVDGLLQPVTAKRNLTAVAVALLIALAAISAFVGITHSLQLWGGKVVPDVTGMQRDEAQAVLAESGFAASVDLVAYDGDPDIVVSMEPAADSRIDEGECVTLRVSRARLVPNVVGMDEDAARQALEAEGLSSVDCVEEESAEQAESVLSVVPGAGEVVSSDSIITITVAVGYKVPDVCGMAERSAIRALQEKGYLASVESVVDEDVEAGTVVSMQPAAGEEAPYGSTVALRIAVHESDGLIDDTRAYLESLSDFRFDGTSYELMEVEGVAFDGGRSCRFTLRARPFEAQGWLGFGDRRRYGSECELSGTIEWSEDGSVASTSPSLEAL